MNRRAAFSMTIDPEGAMHDWVDAPAGWTVEPVPTQEAVHVLGIRAYQDLLVDLAERERPHLLVTHPPYDYLDEAAAARIRAAGTRIVGYAFDDEIFAHHYGDATCARLAAVYDRYVTTREVRWATAPLPALPERAPDLDVVLVGRAYQRRVELVEALRAAGIGVTTYGLGWPHGFASRALMLELYARAAVVLTTGDWEGHEVPMVKHRLLDTALLGAFQIAQESPDLRGYFAADEVPSYASAEELVARVRAALVDPAGRRAAAARARRRAVAEHSWSARWPELLAGLDFAPPAAPPARSPLLDQLLLTLATRAEADKRLGAAAELFRAVLARAPAQPAAAAGLGRCLSDLGHGEAALPHLRAAAAALTDAAPCAAALHCKLPHFGVGTGLGRMGLFPPESEALIFLVKTLCDLGRIDQAAAVVDAVRAPATRRALRTVIILPEDDASLAALAAALARD